MHSQNFAGCNSGVTQFNRNSGKIENKQVENNYCLNNNTKIINQTATHGNNRAIENYENRVNLIPGNSLFNGIAPSNNNSLFSQQNAVKYQQSSTNSFIEPSNCIPYPQNQNFNFNFNGNYANSMNSQPNSLIPSE